MLLNLALIFDPVAGTTFDPAVFDLAALGRAAIAPLDGSALADWSRQYCLQICAFLVPANLLATIQTLTLLVLDRPLAQVALMAAVATGYATAMVLHVGTWFAVGVVMAPTYVLLSLAIACLGIDGWAIARTWRRRTVAIAEVPARG